MQRCLPAFALCALLFFELARADGPGQITGVWVNADEDGWIELQVVEGELTGVIVGSPQDPDNEKPSRLDDENPDPALRSRKLLGLQILHGFRHDREGRWVGGRIYDPNSGNTYRGTITVIDQDTLDLRGYVGISLFGRTETWRRKNKI